MVHTQRFVPRVRSSVVRSVRYDESLKVCSEGEKEDDKTFGMDGSYPGVCSKS